MIIFAMLGCILFMSKITTEFLPNIHPVTILICVYTLVYRSRALIPIYIFVAVSGVFYGFALWWLSYLYIWAFAWALFMLIPKNISLTKIGICSTILCAIHGILYGTLTIPSWAIWIVKTSNAKITLTTLITYVIAGIPFDVLHMIGNIALSILIIPLYKTLIRLEKSRTI